MIGVALDAIKAHNKPRMRLEADIHIHLHSVEPDPRIDEVIGMLNRILANQGLEKTAMSEMDDAVTKLTADVAAERTVVDSAIAYAKGVPALIQTAIDTALAAGATQAQLQAVTDAQAALETQATDLAAAIPANTPAAVP